MTVTINGTSGIAGTNGSAGTPAVQGEDTNTGLFFPAADTVGVATGGAERVRVDSSGNVLIGTATSVSNNRLVIDQASGDGANSGFLMQRNGAAGTSFKIDIDSSDVANFRRGVTNAMSIDSSGNVGIGTSSPGRTLDVFGIIRSDGTSGAFALGGNSSTPAEGAAIHRPAANTLAFVTASTERARIDSDGNLLVGLSTSSGYRFQAFTGALTAVARFGRTTDATARSAIVLYSENQATGVGSIQVTNTATSYVTSSDYRLKENVQPMTGALDKIAQLNPVTYTWKADGTLGQGFIAHELQAVVPDCVTGEKDAVDEDGNPDYQGVDTSFLVATLVKAIQELTARVAELEAK